MAHLFPESLEKILYLDCDMTVVSSLAELFATDLTDEYAAVVAETVSMPHLASLHLQYPYFNSGMVLFNLKKYRQDRMEERAFDFADKHREMLLFPDQDILNVIFGGNVVFVPMKWNCIQHHWLTFFSKVNETIFRMVGRQFPEDFWKQLYEAERSPCIIHYSLTKPWDGGCNSPLAGEYWKYARQTPFYEQLRFSWQRIWRNVLNVFLLGAYPIVHYLVVMRKK